MKFLVSFIVAVFFLVWFNAALAQNTLPDFSIGEIGKTKVLISWTSPFPNCIQLAVQRSFDSTKFFNTVYSAISPNLPQNGFTDNKMPPGVKAYYRIFYVLEGGAYFFSKSQSIGILNIALTNSITLENDIPKPIDFKKLIRIYNRDKPKEILELDYIQYRRFRDSIITKTKDSIYVVNANTIMVKPFMIKGYWRPSINIFTTNKGYVNLHLPLIKLHKYRVVFFEEDGTELFEIKQIKEADLTLDYTNFIHAGWFSFELFEDDKLKEKNKFLLTKLF
ncbi:MAG: hypothetical protein H7068_08705 [Pedobacter sp.]|nr:hypothetical protein [Chitinophagaceae bacterium]